MANLFSPVGSLLASRLQFLEGSVQSRHRQVTGMNRSLRQTADCFYQFLPAQLACFGDRPSLQKFGEQRTAGQSGNASLSKKANLFDASADNFEG